MIKFYCFLSWLYHGIIVTSNLVDVIKWYLSTAKFSWKFQVETNQFQILLIKWRSDSFDSPQKDCFSFELFAYQNSKKFINY